MTLVLAWIDNAKTPTALHIAADSRLSEGQTTWDHGTKIFQMFPSQAYFAYTGDCLLALQATNLLSATDVLSNHSTNKAPTLCAKLTALKSHIGSLPIFPWETEGCTFLISEYNNRSNSFDLYKVKPASSEIAFEKVDLLRVRYLCLGSGAEKAISLLEELKDDELDEKAFLNVLQSVINDKGAGSVGGYRQMVTIRSDSSEPVGFVVGKNSKQKFYLFGMPVKFESTMDKVRFIDENYSQINLNRKKKIQHAQ